MYKGLPSGWSEYSDSDGTVLLREVGKEKITFYKVADEKDIDGGYPICAEPYLRGLIHRRDGPSVIFLYKNRRMWYIEEKLHRLDGPAIEDDNGNEYFVDGRFYSDVDFSLTFKKPSETELINLWLSTRYLTILDNEIIEKYMLNEIGILKERFEDLKAAIRAGRRIRLGI